MKRTGIFCLVLFLVLGAVLLASCQGLFSDDPDKQQPTEAPTTPQAEPKLEFTTVGAAGDYYICKGAAYVGEAVIPETYDGKPVKEIDDWAFGEGLTGVVIPAGVEKIGANAFSKCKNLKTVIIMGSDVEIGNDAFKNCKVEVLTIADHLLEHIPTENVRHATVLGSGVIRPEILTDDPYPLARSRQLTTLTFSDEITGLGRYIRFYQSTNLISVTLGAKMEKIEASFDGCEKLIEVVNRSNMDIQAGSEAHGGIARAAKHVIADSADSMLLFESDCYFYQENGTYQLLNYHGTPEVVRDALIESERLTMATLPQTLRGASYEIAPYAFYAADYTFLKIPEGIEKIGHHALEDSNVSGVIFPNSIAFIGEDALETASSKMAYKEEENARYFGNEENPYLILMECKNSDITSFEVPAGTKIIYQNAFEDCSALAGITLPSGLTQIGDEAFQGCSALNGVMLPTTLKEIGSAAFAGCANLTEITIPASVTEIKEDTFASCTRLANVTFSENLTRIGEAAFESCAISALSLPNGLKQIGKEAFAYCEVLERVYFYAEGCTMNSDVFSNCPALSELHISDLSAYCSCPTAGFTGDLYLNNTLVTELVIPAGVTSIGSGLFSGFDAIVSVTIPASVTFIDDAAFAKSTSIGSFTVASENAAYASVNGSLYTKDGKRLLQYCVASDAASFTVPDGVEEIAAYAFYGCSALTNVVLPETLRLVSNSSFENCTQLQMNTWSEHDEVSYLGTASNPYFVALRSTEEGSFTLTLHDDTKVIASQAFYSCRNIQKIELNDGLLAIGSYAIGSCNDSIKLITIPASVKYIGVCAFAGVDASYYAGFVNPQRWEVTNGETTQSMKAEDLEDAYKAGDYLFGIYKLYAWVNTSND